MCASSLISRNVYDLVNELRVLTLAVHSGKGTWAAPVYYVFSKKFFYFFSSPDSRHIREALAADCSSEKDQLKNNVAASVFYDDENFRRIKGLQMQGSVIKVENKKDAVLYAMEYIKKFKIRYSGGNLLDFFREKYSSSLYCFVPEIVYYMDNTEKIGHREIIEL